MSNFLKAIVAMSLCCLITFLLAAKFYKTPNAKAATANHLLDALNIRAISIKFETEKVSISEADSFVVVNLWATWCKPCIAEIGLLNQAYDDYSGRGIKFIAISCDDKKERAKAFLDNHDFRFKNIFIGDINKQYDIWQEASTYAPSSIGFGKTLPITIFYLPKLKKVNVVTGGFENYNELLKEIKKNFNIQ